MSAIKIDELIKCIRESTVRIAVMRETYGPQPEVEHISYIDGDKLINAIKELVEAQAGGNTKDKDGR